MVKPASRNKSKRTPETADRPGATISPDSTVILTAVAGCFYLSGFAALLYQTAWMRQFSITFGTSEIAVATVLSSYMAGLALGAALAGRFVDRIKRPVLVYGLLEGLIAVSALCVPLMLKAAGMLYALALGGQPGPPDASGLGQSFFYLLVAFLVIMIPTASMGATLPLLTKYAVRTKEQIGPRVGLLYAINTVGAISGTLVAAFVLLPRAGLLGTVQAGVVVNLIVFMMAAGLARRMSSGEPRITATETTATRCRVSVLDEHGWILPVMLLSGAATFTYEVLWTRLLNHILGGSVAAFATMLASFLGGIALGSAVASRVARGRKVALVGFTVAQLGIAVSSAIIYELLHLAVPETAGLADNIITPIVILLPATLFIGATFPLAVRILAGNEALAPRASASVFSWNTSGAIVGAAISGFILIPLLKYEGAIRMAVMINLALAMFAGFKLTDRKALALSAMALLVGTVAVFYKPGWPEEILRVSAVGDQPDGEIRYYDVGRSSTVLLLERDGFFYLRNDGLPQASIDLAGAPPSRHTQRLLTSIPIMARPNSRNGLVIGFGGGVALENLAPGLEQVDVLELEPRVIDANRAISGGRSIDPLDDPRINIIVNDARSALRLTDKTYDFIVSQPSHPWTAGASHLYTREFMQLVGERLTDSGVYLQWMNSAYLNRSLLRSLTRTMSDVFPHVRVYQFYPNVLFFLGSRSPLDIEQQMIATGEPLSSDPDYFMGMGIASVEDMLASLMMDEQGVREFSLGAPVITDNRNLMATESGLLWRDSGKAVLGADIDDMVMLYSPLFDGNSWVYELDMDVLNFMYMGQHFRSSGSIQLLDRMTEVLVGLERPSGFSLAAYALLDDGQFEPGIKSVLRALSLNPKDDQARYLLVRQYADRLFEGTALQVIRDQYELLPPSARAVVDLLPASEKGKVTGQAAMKADETLALARCTDLWYLIATKFRVDWRIQFPDPVARTSHARDALKIIDSAIGIYYDLDFYGMRFAAAYLASEPGAVVETARRLVWMMQSDLDETTSNDMTYPVNMLQRDALRARSLATGIEKVIEEGQVEAYKLESIRAQIEKLSGRYQAIASQQGLDLK